MTDYIKQANDFAVKTGTTMEILCRRSGTMPLWNDNVIRDIYTIRLSRQRDQGPEEIYILDFGQSEVQTEKRKNARTQKEEQDAKPTIYDILACLAKCDPGDYDIFCAEFGYEEPYDIRSGRQTHERIYNAVCEEYENVMRLFGDVIEELYEIQ